MKISKPEKLILGVLITLLVVFGTMLYNGLKEVEKAGGFNQVLIEAGKELKDISREIDKH